MNFHKLFTHEGNAPTVATPEATQQNPEINPDTAKQVADLGLQAVQSEVQVKTPEATIENSNFTIPEASEPAIEANQEDSRDDEVDILETDNDEDLLSTAGTFGGGELPSAQATEQTAKTVPVQESSVAVLSSEDHEQQSPTV